MSDAPAAGRSSRARGLIAGGVVLVLLLAAVWIGSSWERGHLDQGVALFERGLYADAAHHFWRYAEAHPDELAPQLYLVRIHQEMGRPALAAQALRRAQRIAPDDPEVRALASALGDAATNADPPPSRAPLDP